MENNFGKIFKKDGAGDEYVNFSLWQIILVGVAFLLIVTNSFVNGQGVMVWVVNFLLQLALFFIGAAIIASLVNMIFKRGWATVFAVVVLIASLFGTYDAIRGFNYRKTMEKAYQAQMEQAKQEQEAKQQNQSNVQTPATSPVVK